MSLTFDVLSFMVATQALYLVWNAKSIVLYGRFGRERLFADAVNPLPIDSMDLPKITAILAARDEPELVLKRSVLSLLSLNYPADKKEILLVTDFDDVDTGILAEQISRELGVVHVVVPENSDPSWNVIIRQARERGAKWADLETNSLPHTKPRALIYALQKATGQIITVVDAEDIQGDPQVFRKAAQCLQVKKYDAVQGRLRFINYRDSWLSLQAVGDYAFWFAWLLPMVRLRGLPVAFGGTCYYVRREVLESVGGWDPTNVTEDLELGLRLYGYGYRVGIIDVDTFEESPRTLLRTQTEGGWVNQRTRWIRGTLYTAGRIGRYWREFSLRRRIGIGLLLFYYILGFFIPFLSILGYPLMVLSFVAAIILPIESISGIAPSTSLLPVLDNPWLAGVSAFNMILLFWHVFLTVRGISRTVGKTVLGMTEKLRYYGIAATTVMFYWILWGFPVLRAFWQTMRGANFWEKTRHEGLHHAVLDKF
jgi:cellulose synthase/poly-beta-1,6-N-acetylglucosamine synthase-like glycosyltransferase